MERYLLLQNEKFFYPCDLFSHSKIKAFCKLRIFIHDKNVLVILTELKKNPGPSITNTAVQLVNYVLDSFEFLDTKNTIFIEHYSSMESYGERKKNHSFKQIIFEKDEKDGQLHSCQWVHLGTGSMFNDLFDILLNEMVLFQTTFLLEKENSLMI